MFRDGIYKTPMTTGVANTIFCNVQTLTSIPILEGDVSFISTLRALLYPRMQDDDTLSLYFKQSSISTEYIRRNNARTAIREIYDAECTGRNQIVVHSFSGSSECNAAWMALMESSLTKEFPEWHRLDKVTGFFKKSFDVLCFINHESKSALIFLENINLRKMHYLQCSVLAFLPWYFDPKAGVSELEMELIESLRSKDSTAYKDCLAKIAEQYNFRSENIRRLLSGFELRYERQECEKIKDLIQSRNGDIETHNRRISDCLKTIRDAEIRLLGLEAKISNSSDESEIMDYFLRNDRLVLESVDDRDIVFTVKSCLEYFDEDMASRAINNDTSYVYRPVNRDYSSRINKDDMRKLMTAVFIDQTVRIKVCATYRFSLDGDVSGLSSWNYGFECREYTPNPHIDEYRCLGNYTISINEFLKQRDYIGAIEQCAASCKSLNFGDSIVMSEFMKRIYGVSSHQNRINMKCFELPDGTVVTPKEAINWINSQEVQSNE